MESKYKWHRCNILYLDREMENIGIEKDMWVESYINLGMVVGFSRGEQGGTQLMLQNECSVLIDTSFEEFKEILTE